MSTCISLFFLAQLGANQEMLENMHYYLLRSLPYYLTILFPFLSQGGGGYERIKRIRNDYEDVTKLTKKNKKLVRCCFF